MGEADEGEVGAKVLAGAQLGLACSMGPLVVAHLLMAVKDVAHIVSEGRWEAIESMSAIEDLAG